MPQLLPRELPCRCTIVQVNQKVTTHHCDIVQIPKWAHNIAKRNQGVEVEKFNSILQREEKCVEIKRFSDILISLVAMKFTVQ